MLEEGALERDLEEYRRAIEIPAEQLTLEQRTAFMNEGWLEPVPLNLPRNYPQLSPDSQIEAQVAAAETILNHTLTMMLNSVSPPFRRTTELLKNSVIPEGDAAAEDGKIRFFVNPFPPGQTAAGALFATSLRADQNSGNWFVEFRANLDRFSPESPLASPPFDSRLFLGVGLFHDLEHIRLAKYMGDFLRSRQQPLADIVYQLEHDSWQEPFAHWMVAVFADSTLDWNDPRIRTMGGAHDSVTADTMEYRRLLTLGKQWYSPEWQKFVTKNYLAESARPHNYPTGIAWIPPLKFQAEGRSVALTFPTDNQTLA